MDCLCYQWEVGGVPGDDMERLARVMRCTVAEARRTWPVIASKFNKGDDGLYRNARLESVREEKRVWHESRKKNGARGGRPPKQETTSEPSGNLVVNLVVPSSSSSSSVPTEQRDAHATPPRRRPMGDPFGFKPDPNMAALIDLGEGRTVAIPESWAKKARDGYRLSFDDIGVFAKWLGARQQRLGGVIDDEGKRLPWLDARLGEWLATKARPGDGYRPASEWIEQNRKASEGSCSPEEARAILAEARAKMRTVAHG
jgi:hypothetical protein